MKKLVICLATVLALSQPVFASSLTDWYNGEEDEQTQTSLPSPESAPQVSDSQYSVPQAQVTMYEQKILSPGFGNVAVGKTMVPEGWTPTVTDLMIVTSESITCPNAILLNLKDPTGDYELTYISRREFSQKYVNMSGFEYNSQDDAFDTDDMMHTLDYRDADGVCDIMIQVLYGNNVSFVKQNELDPEVQAQLPAAKAKYAEEMNNAMTASGIIDYGTQLTFTDLTAAERVYTDGYYNYTISALSCGFQLNTEGYGVQTTRTSWAMPVVIVLKTPANVHDQYQEMFDVFCAGTAVSKEYEELREKNSLKLFEEWQQIKNSGSTVYQPSSGSFSDNESETIDTGDTYTAMDGWDDVIRDETDYTTGDGSHIKVPTAFDHVFEGDNGEIYVSNSPDGPAGTVELDPTQIGE